MLKTFEPDAGNKILGLDFDYSGVYLTVTGTGVRVFKEKDVSDARKHLANEVGGFSCFFLVIDVDLLIAIIRNSHGLLCVHELIDPLLACSTLDLYSSVLKSQFRLSRSCSSCYAEEPTPDTGTREKEREREKVR